MTLRRGSPPDDCTRAAAGIYLKERQGAVVGWCKR